MNLGFMVSIFLLKLRYINNTDGGALCPFLEKKLSQTETMIIVLGHFEEKADAPYFCVHFI